MKNTVEENYSLCVVSVYICVILGSLFIVCFNYSKKEVYIALYSICKW